LDELAIQTEHLGKLYRIGIHPRYLAMRDTIANLVYAPVRLPRLLLRGRRDARPDEPKTIWALRDVNLELRHGEVMGLIGSNGSGKSTLLKVLSRITEPTEGTAVLRGRVGSLLEVGTGFHPELTGRENVYLNGAILGMRRDEIRRRFDEIVEFADMTRFIDTPVKRYSSGMQVRLAFGVAAHLDTEILLVDEVLAVGDAAFQRKCLGKINEVTAAGRTAIFVSHNMSSIRQLCPTCLWLDNGTIRMTGKSPEVIESYLAVANATADQVETVFPELPNTDFQVRSVRLVDTEGRPRQNFEVSETPVIEIDCEVRKTIPGLFGYIRFRAADGIDVLEGDSFDLGGNPLEHLTPGRHVLQVQIPPYTLGHGAYAVYLKFGTPFEGGGGRIHAPLDVAMLHLDDLSSRKGNNRIGYLSTRLGWHVTPELELADERRRDTSDARRQ